MVERAAIAAMVVEAGDVTDEAFLNESVGGLLARNPDQGPVDDQFLAGGRHGSDHGVRFRQGAGKGFLHEHVHAERRHFFHPLAMNGGSGAKDDEVRLRLLQAGDVVGEDLGIGEAKVFLRAGHARRLFVTDGDDVGCGVVEDLTQQVAHVEMIKVDACDAPLFHGLRCSDFCWRIG